MNTEKELRKAWEAGFKLAVDYADNHFRCVGKQADAQWNAYFAKVSAPPDPDEHLPDDQYIAKKQERFAANPQSDEDPAPVLVAFSEAERLTAMDEYEYSLEQNTSYPVQQRLDMTAAFGAGIRHANTRAVSVDQLVEAATEVLDGMDNSISFIYVDDLREAFTKLVTTNER